MDRNKHEDPRSEDQKRGDRESQGPRDSEHRDGARHGEPLGHALDKQTEAECEERKHPGQPPPPPASPR